MPEFFLGLLFIILAIILFVRFIISAKKQMMFAAFAVVSLVAGILVFSFITDWDFAGNNNNLDPPINGVGNSDEEPEEPEEPGEPDEEEPNQQDPEPEEPNEPEQPQPDPRKIEIPDDGVIEYVVVKGDTLFNISQRAGVPIEKIKQWNQLSSDEILIGQVLKLYGKNKEPAPQKPQEPGDYSPSKIIVRGNTSVKKIAFTFDAGSDIAGIEILNVLKKHNVKATFFLTGKWVENFPSYAKRIVNEGHELGNHTYSHPDAVKTSSSAFYDNIKKAEQIITSTTGVSPQPYFRFPYGSYNKAALDTVGKAGYPYSIHWSIDTLDWQQPSADVIAQRILDKAQNGDIVLMHIGGINTPAGVDKAIPKLKERGFEIVPLSEVLK